ncbi:unnamed protein product [Auanema sp. JU1783]|nr:unnamed protein product [Auanema sp. JU1783]
MVLSKPLRSLLLGRNPLIKTLSSYSENHHNGSKNEYANYNSINAKTLPILAGASLLGAYYLYDKTRTIHADASHQINNVSLDRPRRPELPIYRSDDVKKHGKSSERIWVTFMDGVYDVTDFVISHPGGDKILLAAGGPVDPFWALYAQHKTAEVFEILESLRIGTLHPDDLSNSKEVDASDPFSTDPIRHPALVVNNEKPFNAEGPPSLITDSFYTPNELFFVRNHLPVPKTDKDSHILNIEGIGFNKPLTMSIKDLQSKYEEVTIVSVVQCAGNRRAEMNEYKKVAGLMWKGTAIGNAKWTGVRLRDVLIAHGVDPNSKSIKHVHMEGADKDPTGTPYGASIPFEKAMSPETVIAYRMNDVDIPADHGAPLRLIVPGNVGARQVKWLTMIRLSDVESPSHWQRKDYRVFSPHVQMGDELDWDKVHSIQEYPIQCTFCVPSTPITISREEEYVDVSGYAWSGGGRGIIRVEVSGDGGETWQSAELEQEPSQDAEHMWAWTLFKASVKIPQDGSKMMLVAKATDRSYNTQPETPVGIWNVRGLLHNAWPRIEVTVTDE